MNQLNFFCNLFFLLILTNVKAQDNPSGNDKIRSDFSFAFITDIHLQPEFGAVDGFKKAIDTINKLKPDFVVTGGDEVIDANQQTRGRTDSLFNLYLQTAKLLQMPVYNTIGNHDLYGTFLNEMSPDAPMYGKKIFEAKIGKRYQSFMFKGWKFIILDDIDESVKRKYKGYVDSLELKWVKKELSVTDPQTPIAIALHIPLITTITLFEQGALVANPEGLVVNNSKELLDLFKGYNLKLVLQGHLHIFENLLVHNIHFITGGAISGWKWKGPNNGTKEGFVMVHVNGNELTFDYIDYGWKAKQLK